MKRYEALFILSTAGKEDGIKETIDKISNEITATGGKVETVQKMDKRSFARVSSKKHSAGFYLNIIFEIEPGALAQMKKHFTMNEEIFRVLLTAAPPPKVAAA
jgi:ribosomal protein S6